MARFGRPLVNRHATQRRGTPIDFLIVGLGNPGKEYARTRHNVGQEVVTKLAQELGTKLKASKDKALVADANMLTVADDGSQSTCKVVLAFPTTYVNESGMAVGALARRYATTDPTQIIVVHDELDLEPGVVRVKVGGGLAGHNGLRSINQHLKTQDFIRVRIGVGKPRSKEQGADHVLHKVPVAERELLDVAVARAVDAVKEIVAHGTDSAMRDFNGI